jgi:hypothetical protein
MAMNKRTETMLANFSDKEIRYIITYAQEYLVRQQFRADDGTLQGDLVKRMTAIIEESRK